MKVTYLITCSTETTTLLPLLSLICSVVKAGDDEMVVLVDKEAKNNDVTKEILANTAVIMGYEMVEKKTCKILEHPLNNDYGAHKNFGIERSTGDFIFQIDGDELPPEALLGENLHALLEGNPAVEAYAVPRMNDFKGVTEAHAKQWGWRLSYNARPSLTDKTMGPLVNWPDYQWRIFKRDYPRISFTRRLHEKIEGYGAHTVLPAEHDYALYHDKTIEKQIETNLRYNKMFTQEENRGHNVFSK